MVAAAIVVIVACVTVWLTTHETLPRTIRIATGEKTGLYHDFGEALAPPLGERTGRDVEVRVTPGSETNRQLLDQGEVDLALLQAGFLKPRECSIVAPLYPEPIHVIVRKGSGIEKTADLVGRRIALGPKGSGMRVAAQRFLRHYGVDPEGIADNERYFADLLDDPNLDGAIVVAGFLHRDLTRVLGSGQFDLLPIKDAEAVALKDPHLHTFTIPRGLYAESPAVPDRPIPTLTTTAVLVVRRDAPDVLVDATLRSIHEEGLGLDFPMLIPRKQITEWMPIPMHPAAREFFYPEDHMGWLANVMESLAAMKELLFALGAGLYLLWLRCRSLKEREREEHLQAQKDRLDRFLTETLEIEVAQMDTTDPKRLQSLLDQVTGIKLRALKELTAEELRGDRTFSIFLLQCSNLSNNIQLKILNREAL
jgi:TRAP transporter TAXI family solute receptor